MTNLIEKKIVVFSDGAAKGNPGPAGWGAVIATPEGQVKEIGGQANSATNNQMELLGTIKGFQSIRRQDGDVVMLTDSVYVLKGITAWIYGWMRRGWTNAEGDAVKNTDLWQQLYQLASERKERGAIQWGYTRGHAGIPGNERADEIASSFAQKKRPKLYEGPLIKYGIPLYDLPEDISIPERSASQADGKRKKAHSYLSLINGKLYIDKTWAECEARVKGRPGVRFKKAMSAADEKKIREEWGV